MRRALVVAVLVAVVTAGALAGSAVSGPPKQTEFTLGQAYYAGIISRRDLADWGCVPAGNRDIVCAPTDFPWCTDAPGRLPGFTTDFMHTDSSWECQVSPYDISLSTGFRSVGPVRIPRKI